MIVGSKITTATFDPQTEGEVLLRTHAGVGRIAQDVTLELRRGEVLGLTGLMGMGHEEVPYLLFGAEPATGELELDGERMRGGRRCRRAGPSAPASPCSPATASARAARDAVACARTSRCPRSSGSSPAAFCVPSASAPACSSSCASTTCAPAAPARKLETLSGGNQQKALVAKWLERKPTIFLMHEPVQGVDVERPRGDRAGHRRHRRRGWLGAASSCEYEDLARICGRVLVFRHGRVTSELAGTALTKERIIERCYATEMAA